jgi:hypothetical protein
MASVTQRTKACEVRPKVVERRWWREKLSGKVTREEGCASAAIKNEKLLQRDMSLHANGAASKAGWEDRNGTQEVAMAGAGRQERKYRSSSAVSVAKAAALRSSG